MPMEGFLSYAKIAVTAEWSKSSVRIVSEIFTIATRTVGSRQGT